MEFAVIGGMNSNQSNMDPRHGFGFLAIGFLMWMLPALIPAWFPAPLFGGANGQAMWLEGMGVIQMLLGGGLVLRHLALPALVRWAAVPKSAEGGASFAFSKLRGGARL
jgi:hypothetical protein